MRSIILIAHDIRSIHNVGSLLRTAEGLGVDKIYLTGYTPYPNAPNDTRLPHIAKKINDTMHKTSLGAELTATWEHVADVHSVLQTLQQDGYRICALEQTDEAVALHKFIPPSKCALLLGSEVTGIADELLSLSPIHIVIPMFGQKESFNVVQAAAMALYHLRFS